MVNREFRGKALLTIVVAVFLSACSGLGSAKTSLVSSSSIETHAILLAGGGGSYVTPQAIKFSYGLSSGNFQYSLNLQTGVVLTSGGQSVYTLTASELSQINGMFQNSTFANIAQIDSLQGLQPPVCTGQQSTCNAVDGNYAVIVTNAGTLNLQGDVNGDSDLYSLTTNQPVGLKSFLGGVAQEIPGACQSESTQSCSVSNGSGTQTCAGDGSGWGACQATSCNSMYSLNNGVCVLTVPAPAACQAGTTRSCTPTNGTSGTQACAPDGSDWLPACQATACNAGFTLNSGTCVADQLQFGIGIGNGTINVSPNGPTMFDVFGGTPPYTFQIQPSTSGTVTFDHINQGYDYVYVITGFSTAQVGQYGNIVVTDAAGHTATAGFLVSGGGIIPPHY